MATSDAVIVIFLRGGADGLSLIPPIGDDDYYRTRPGLAIDERDAIPLDGLFGLHPRLAPLESLYRDGHLAVIPAVGSNSDTRSHFEAQDIVEGGGEDVAGGWLGRWLRLAPPATKGFPAVALATSVPRSLSGAPGAVAVDSLKSLTLDPTMARRRHELEVLYASDTLLAGPAADTLRAVDRIERIARTVDPASAHDMSDAGDRFAASLQQVALLLKADIGLRAACLDLPGWDSHIAQALSLEPLLDALGRGLATFATSLGPLLDRTSVVVMTEFGRRVAPNSAGGTDHGRASVMLVLGNVRGGVHGRWPGLVDLDGPGDVRVAQDIRDVLAAVLARHGPKECLSDVFPDHRLAPMSL